ncbi:DUF4190 domain-containing protein [Mycobacteroides sp. LB1]|uniref:DUF4190 domain-containing protein n=1 Tax=Mycobacteroides sp. LB1 TaxID=2750814 RepID=UPI0015DF1E21|nr:DUF4190 domain-containing protein [Mycobacteroides sp. LB1]
MTSPGSEPFETGTGPGPNTSPDASSGETSSGYEYPSLERSAPPADSASSAYQVPPSIPPAWETPGAPPSYPAVPPAYPTAPPQYPTAPPAYPPYPQYGQGYPPYQSGQPGAYPPPVYPAAGGYPGYPAPGYADPYGYGAYAPTGGTNGLAIGSLIASVMGPFTCGLGSVAGLIMGFIALSQLKTSPQDGKGLAITGIVISAAVVLFGLLFLIIGIASHGGSSSGSY